MLQGRGGERKGDRVVGGACAQGAGVGPPSAVVSLTSVRSPASKGGGRGSRSGRGGQRERRLGVRDDRDSPAGKTELPT